MTRADAFPENLGYFLILPDALLQGLVLQIGRYLADRGLHPVAVTAEVVSEDDRAALYDHGARSKYSESGRVYGRVMTRSLLSLDNCLAVLVTGDVASGDVSRRLHDLKGQSSFLKRRPGSLRAISGSADRCMSLIHTPDDAVEAARDAPIFFRTVDVDASRGTRELDWELIPACRAWAAPSPGQSRYSIAVRTVLRCAALLLGGAERGYSATEYAQLWHVYDACRSWLEARVAASTVAEHQRFLGQCAGLEPLAVRLVQVAAARHPRDEMFAQIILTLVRPSSFSHAEGLHLLAVLEKAELMLSPYEAHHLLTLMTFLHDLPRARANRQGAAMQRSTATPSHEQLQETGLLLYDRSDLLRHNVVLITLDSCRFDTAVTASTPTLDGIGELRRAESYASFTLPAHAAIFGGFLPNVREEPLRDFYSKERRQLWRLRQARQPQRPRHLLLLSGDNIIEGYRNLGYRTIGAGGVRWFSSGYLPSLFDEFHYWGPADDATDKFAPRREEDFALSHARHIAERAGTAERFFLFINAAETHAPYGTCHGPVNVTTILRRWSSHWNGASPLPPGEEAATDMGLLHAAQISALETIDRRLGVLFDMLPGPLLIVICGDHGEAFGESAMWGHDMPAKVVMEVPLWIGTTESTTN